MHLSLQKWFPLFILASSVCKSLQCLIPALTQGGEGDHLFRLTCSVVLWGGRSTANKYHWHVWGVLTVSGPHCICPCSWQHMLSQSTPIKLQVSLQGYCPKQALQFLHFPGLSCSGSDSQILPKGTDSVGVILCPSQVRAAQVTRCLASALSQGCLAS